MQRKITLPQVPFYFIRHGETDWNKFGQGLCPQDEIPLNETGVSQANDARKKLGSLNITKIYSSPLLRAKQTAEIIKTDFSEIAIEFHHGLSETSPEKVKEVLSEILEPSQTLLIVSHGEVYRVLLRILNTPTFYPSAKNGGLYFFSPPILNSDQWRVYSENDEE